MSGVRVEERAEAPPAPARPPRWTAGQLLGLLTVLVVVAGLALRLAAVLAAFGVIYPDETYQMTEPAHRVVFGYGLVPWEFQQGTRSWLGPGLLLPPTLLWRALGLDGGDGTALVRAWVVLGSGLSSGAAAVLARRLAGPAAGLLAAALVAFSPVGTIYDIHPLADTVAAPLVISAVALLVVRRRATGAAALAGVLLVAALVLRPQLLPVVIAVALATLLGPGRARTRPLVLGAAAALVADGVLDAVTWGAPFASLWRTVAFNIVQDGARHFGTSPWSSYLAWSARSAGPLLALVLLAGLVLACRRPRGAAGDGQDVVRLPVLVAGLAGFVVGLSAIGHKELRFLVPALPLAGALAAVGLTRWLCSAVAALARRRGAAAPRPGVLVAVLAALVVANGVFLLPRLTTIDLGYAWSESALHMDETAPRLLAVAGRSPDACGVVVLTESTGWSGGYTVLHRDVPFAGQPHWEDLVGWPEWANVVVADKTTLLPRAYRTVTTDGGQVLAQRPGGCAAPPARVARRLLRGPEELGVP